MPQQSGVGSSPRSSVGASLAPSDVVHSSSANVVRASSGDGVDCSERSSNPPARPENAQPAGSPQFDGMSCVRQLYREQGFSEHVTDVLLSSWRPATQKQYIVYLKKMGCSSKLQFKADCSVFTGSDGRTRVSAWASWNSSSNSLLKSLSQPKG